jgi:hypothetical protein
MEEALVESEILPLAAAWEVGEYMTAKVAVCDGPRITPPETPLVVNEELGTLTL